MLSFIFLGRWEPTPLPARFTKTFAPEAAAQVGTIVTGPITFIGSLIPAAPIPTIVGGSVAGMSTMVGSATGGGNAGDDGDYGK